MIYKVFLFVLVFIVFSMSIHNPQEPLESNEKQIEPEGVYANQEHRKLTEVKSSTKHHSKFNPELIIEFEPKIAKGDENVFIATITYKDKPLTKADVSFEIWSALSGEQKYVEASEIAEGVYEMRRKFETSGHYYGNIHITSDSMQEHREIEFSIKKQN